ncbi:MAG TPA: hypothetical protein VIH27_01555 [Nitrososphaerales archaeon]
MLIEENEKGSIINLYVKINDSFKLELIGDELMIFCKSPREKNKINIEIIRHFTKLFKTSIIIKSGLRSRNKRILITNKKPEIVKLMIEELTRQTV